MLFCLKCDDNKQIERKKKWKREKKRVRKQSEPWQINLSIRGRSSIDYERIDLWRKRIVKKWKLIVFTQKHFLECANAQTLFLFDLLDLIYPFESIIRSNKTLIFHFILNCSPWMNDFASEFIVFTVSTRCRSGNCRSHSYYKSIR